MVDNLLRDEYRSSGAPRGRVVCCSRLEFRCQEWFTRRKDRYWSSESFYYPREGLYCHEESSRYEYSCWSGYVDNALN